MITLGTEKTLTGEFDLMVDAIARASSIAICAHTNPDGDALGSQLALMHAVESINPHAVVTPLLADDEGVPLRYAELPGASRLVPCVGYDTRPDVFFIVDTPTRSRLNDGASVLDSASLTLQIDHHPVREDLAAIRYVDDSAAAAGILVLEFIRHAGVELTPRIAQCLMAAVMTDTGSFQFQNTDKRAFMAASLLVEAGADVAALSRQVYQNKSLGTVKAQGLVIDRLGCSADGRIAWSYLSQADLGHFGIDAAECEGMVEIPRSLRGAAVVFFCREAAPSEWRINLRAKDDAYDVSRVAHIYGGGGHRAASGMGISGNIDGIIASILGDVERLLAGELPPATPPHSR